MTICFFGDYDRNYARNRVLIRGLKENGVEILECNVAANDPRKFRNLIKKHKSVYNKYDLMIVGYSSAFSRSLVPLAKIINRKPIVWDAFFSVYDAWVFDKQVVRPRSLKALYYWLADWLSCRLANKILLDTNEHIKYFVKEFKIKRSKFIKALVGTDHGGFEPNEKGGAKNGGAENRFIVTFYGSFIPLQGVQYIVRAAKLLTDHKDIRFRIIGKGQTYKEVIDLSRRLAVDNVEFIDRVGYDELLQHINEANLCLGIFGNTFKALRVIPNKIYDAIAMAKPVITADTPAIRELFTDRENILLCRVADAEGLAEKILEVKENNELREKIARGGYKVFKEKCTPAVIAEKLISDLKAFY